jgi:ketosteroid isomerase-like protein
MPEEPTAPDLVERTRRFFASSNEASVSATGVVDVWLRPLAPDVVWESVGLGTTFEGVEAVRGFLEAWAGRYEDYEIEPQEILDLGNGVVFAISHHTGHPTGSTGAVRLPREVMAHAFVWEDGIVTHVVSSGDTPESRAAAEQLAESRE